MKKYDKNKPMCDIYLEGLTFKFYCQEFKYIKMDNFIELNENCTNLNKTFYKRNKMQQI